MWRYLTANDLNQLRMNQNNRICHYYAKTLMNEQGMFRAITPVGAMIVFFWSIGFVVQHRDLLPYSFIGSY